MKGALHNWGFSGVVGEPSYHPRYGSIRQNPEDPANIQDHIWKKNITNYINLVLLFA